MPPRAPLTHFLALPLHNARSTASLERIAARLEAATEQVRAEQASEAANPGSIGAEHSSQRDPSSRPPPPLLPPSAVRPPATLHLTLGVMSLRAPGSLDAAAAFLAELDMRGLLMQAGAEAGAAAGPVAEHDNGGSSSTGGTGGTGGQGAHDLPATSSSSPPQTVPLQVALRGLHAMQSPRATSVLFAAPHDASRRLPLLAARLRAAFVDAGYVLSEDRPLKLHATLVNTVYAARSASEPSARSPRNNVPPGERGFLGGDDGDGEGMEEDGGGEDGLESKGRDGGGRGGRGRAHGGRGGGRHRGSGRKAPPRKIDAAALIEALADETWAELTLDRVAICEMGAKPDAYGVLRYKEVATASLE